MKIDNIKSSLHSAFPTLDTVGLIIGGNPYFYVARPILTGLHEYYLKTETLANAAYKALAYPFGTLVTTQGPLARKITQATTYLQKSTEQLAQRVFPSAQKPSFILTTLLSSYAKFRGSLYLRKMIPFTIAKLSGAQVNHIPRTSPSKRELFIWCIEAFKLIVSALTEKSATKVQAEAQLKLEETLTKIADSNDPALIDAYLNLMNTPIQNTTNTSTVESAPQEKKPLTNEQKKQRIRELAASLKALREERYSLKV